MSTEQELRHFHLSQFANGALEEQVLRELSKVAENIQDPNTERTAKRSITIKLDFEVSEDRGFAGVKASVTSKLAGMRGVTTFALFREDEQGELYVLEPRNSRKTDPRQLAVVEDFDTNKKEA